MTTYQRSACINYTDLFRHWLIDRTTKKRLIYIYMRTGARSSTTTANTQSNRNETEKYFGKYEEMGERSMSNPNMSSVSIFNLSTIE